MTEAVRRPTPYELIFSPPAFDESVFAGIRDQVDEAGSSSAPVLFMSPAAGELLRALAPDGGREIVAHVSSLVFSAYRFWVHGRHVYRLSEPVFREIVAPGDRHAATVKPRSAAVKSRSAAVESPSDTAVSPPGAAGYVQFPRRVLWARISDNAAAEAVDGFFWSAAPMAVRGAQRLDLLYALGVRAGRPGVSLFDVGIEDITQLGQWIDVAARDGTGGVDFANILPGGELQHYHGMTTAAEALKLAALCFDRIAAAAREWSIEDEAGQTVHVVSDD